MIDALLKFADYLLEFENEKISIMQANSGGALTLPSIVYQVLHAKPYRSDGGLTLNEQWQLDIYVDPLENGVYRAYNRITQIATKLGSYLRFVGVDGLGSPTGLVFIPSTPPDGNTYVRGSMRIERIKSYQYTVRDRLVKDIIVEANSDQ